MGLQGLLLGLLLNLLWIRLMVLSFLVALVQPKNLSTFGYEGADMSVDAEVSRVLEEFHSAGKPQALCCIAPVVAAKVLGSKGVSLTLGNQGSETDWPYQGSIEAAKG